MTIVDLLLQAKKLPSFEAEEMIASLQQMGEASSSSKVLKQDRVKAKVSCRTLF